MRVRHSEQADSADLTCVEGVAASLAAGRAVTESAMTSVDSVRARVLTAIRAILSEMQPALGASMVIEDGTLLIEDLAFDSLKFVDLTVGLERALSVDEFPMQDWVDEELSSGRNLTVGGLVEKSVALLSDAR